MSIFDLKNFLWQCLKINFIFLIIVFVFVLFSEPVYRIHQLFYSGSLEEFEKLLYMTLGAYKLLWIFFNVIPYMALKLMVKKS